MRTIRITLLMVSLFSSMGLAQEENGRTSHKETSQLLNVLRIEFKTQNPLTDDVVLFDIRSLQLDPIINDPERPNHFLILAAGGGLFGLFILDDSLFAIRRTVAFIPPPPVSKSFVVKIVRIWRDSVTVRGFDVQLDQVSFVKRYYLLK